MADRMGAANVPWGSIAVVLAFVSSTLLVQHAFQPLRPGERDHGLPQVGAELEVEARLWEDPFTATRRYETERLARCDKLAASQRNLPVPASAAVPQAADRPKDCDVAHLVRRRDPQTLLRNLDRDGNHDLTDALVVLVMVPGNAFVGAEENRRRTRYAVLAGLQAQGYVPDDAEHFGLLQARHLPPVSKHAEAWSIGLPYEMLSQRPALRGADPTEASPNSYKQVAVLWLDETALPQPKLDAVAALLGQLMSNPVNGSPEVARGLNSVRNQPRLALIGPSTSDGLRTALVDLQNAADRCTATAPAAAASAPIKRCPEMPDKVREGFLQLASAQLFNATATAPPTALPIPQGPAADLRSFIGQRLATVNGTTDTAEVDYRSTIATDDVVLGSLVTELGLRLPLRKQQRVVLVAERDSLYAQALVSELQFRLDDAQGRKEDRQLVFEPHYFFRGLDGATTFDNGGEKPNAAAKDKDGGPPLEWPEARDQLDYLRRLAIALKDSEAKDSQKAGPIAAIGILANDVHDKLLVMQALHDSFPDKVFFTTDLDARYVHPRTLGYTRNLVVASSLPLAFADNRVQAGASPFRDAYQTALFLAAQRAGCRQPSSCQLLISATEAALKSPSVYEIGRQRAVPVAGYDHSTRVRDQHVARTGTSLPMWLTLVAGLLIWPSTPALRAARGWLRDGLPPLLPGDGQRPHQLAVGALTMMHIAVLAFALGTAVEFSTPGRLGLAGILLLSAAVTAAAALLFLTRGLRHGAAVAGKQVLPPWSAPAAGLVLIAAAATWVAWMPDSLEPCTACEPAAWLEGVSAWPSHLVHLLALVALVCILDLQWNRVRRRFDHDTRWLALPLARPPRASPLRADWWRRHTIAGWSRTPSASGPDTVDIDTLWAETAQRAETGARMWRTLADYVVTLGLMTVLFLALSDKQVPEVPVRGHDHRWLVRTTLYTVLALLPLLMVAVADATMLTHRFIGHLSRARSRYPDDTLTRFAAALGHSAQSTLWLQRFAALPWQRHDASAPQVHTLLDNWIDVRLIGRRTAAVAPLIVGPLVIVALLVVARSRLFDNWAITFPVALAICAYLVWLVVLAVLLKRVAELARDKALRLMQADLLWLTGAGSDWQPLVEPFKRLIDEVRNIQQGAFAPLFEQPLFRGLMVPLGGIGSTQLFDYLLLAR